jgi:hypothetical protein
MSRKLYGKDIKPACGYCKFGTLSESKDSILCRKKGVTDINYHCIRFKYDPLRRIPKTQEPPKFDEKSFAID